MFDEKEKWWTNYFHFSFKNNISRGRNWENIFFGPNLYLSDIKQSKDQFSIKVKIWIAKLIKVLGKHGNGKIHVAKRLNACFNNRFFHLYILYFREVWYRTSNDNNDNKKKKSKENVKLQP